MQEETQRNSSHLWRNESIQTCATLIDFWDERVVSRSYQARTSHDANYLLRLYMKDSRFPEPIRCIKTHASSCTSCSKHLSDVSSDTGKTDWLGDLRCE
ncbi:hypothetical protein VTL71DRAFT_6498 [Oculimacula yallundae]|uniref:Uncharacterized protein n=1 Tax=Oculimacula yallundae TaxID=86028 RepID=A0ABR4BXT6_9HELO